MKTFKHDTENGVCTYIEIELINKDVDALAVAANFLMDIPMTIPVIIGTAKLNPKDKHYVKKIGRDVALSKRRTLNYQVFHVSKTDADYVSILLECLTDPNSPHIQVSVKRGKRVRLG